MKSTRARRRLTWISARESHGQRSIVSQEQQGLAIHGTTSKHERHEQELSQGTTQDDE